MDISSLNPVFVHRMRIPFADTDLAGIVHFSNFFRYMENAEHAFFRSLGFSVHPGGSAATDLENYPGFGWPRVSATCDYRKPLRFEESVDVEIRVEDRGAKTVRYEFRFLTEEHSCAVAIGHLTVICVRFDKETKRMRATNIPEAIREKIDSAVAAV
ncbi:MAG: acyl-CoA thioester hydrolase [Verrucomicrobiales bacterium]|jgi:acyl-CoA thioester hydrolase